jgi:hypothetical protein
MKAISLWEPWAGAIPAGLKHIETRSWATNYRGRIAIHAAKTRKGLTIIHPFKNDMMLCFKSKGITDLNGLPLGAVVATADLIDCIEIPEDVLGLIVLNGEVVKKEISFIDDEILFGDYTPGRYAWILENIKPLETPIPAKGYQGLWNFEFEEEER